MFICFSTSVNCMTPMCMYTCSFTLTCMYTTCQTHLHPCVYTPIAYNGFFKDPTLPMLLYLLK